MKKTVKTNEILAVYQIIGSAKYGKMTDEDKIKAWKIARKLKPVATKFDEDSKDAADKLKPSEDFEDKLRKAQEYERLKKEQKPTIDVMTTADFEAFIAELNKYNDLVKKAVDEFGQKEVEVEFEPLGEDAFCKLITSNEWTFGQVTLLGEFVCE